MPSLDTLAADAAEAAKEAAAAAARAAAEVVADKLTAEQTGAAKPPPGYVKVRITKKGHDKIFTGQTIRAGAHTDEIYDKADPHPRFPFGAMVNLPLKIAQAQEENGFAEIQD